MTDFSGLDQAISDQKAVDDQILSKLDELTTQVGAANSQGDQQQVAAAVVAMQQHIADVRSALTGSEGGAHEASSDPNAQAPAPVEPAPTAGDGAVPPSQPGSDPQPPAAADAPASSEPASAPAQPASGGDAVQSAPPA